MCNTKLYNFHRSAWIYFFIVLFRIVFFSPATRRHRHHRRTISSFFSLSIKTRVPFFIIKTIFPISHSYCGGKINFPLQRVRCTSWKGMENMKKCNFWASCRDKLFNIMTNHRKYQNFATSLLTFDDNWIDLIHHNVHVDKAMKRTSFFVLRVRWMWKKTVVYGRWHKKREEWSCHLVNGGFPKMDVKWNLPFYCSQVLFVTYATTTGILWDEK